MPIERKETGPPDYCKGRYFRYIETGFSGKCGRIVVSRELRPLKSISCTGCPDCQHLEFELARRAHEKDFLQFSPALQSGNTVTLLQVPLSRNEDGVLEHWYYEVTPANAN